MQHYELLYIVPISVAEEQIAEVMQSVQKLLLGAKAQIHKEENIGKRKLSYPIKQQRHGTYISVVFDMDTTELFEVERKLRLHTEVLRYLITKKVFKTAEQLQSEEAERMRIREKRASKRSALTLAKPDGKVKVKDLLVEPTDKQDVVSEKVASESEEKVKKTKKKAAPKKEVNLEELDKQLDKILDDNMLK